MFIFMFKFNRNLLPGKFENFFTQNSTIHSYQTRQENHYHYYQARTAIIRQYTVRYQGPLVWNSLGEDVNTSQSLKVFRRKIKMFLLSKYY